MSSDSELTSLSDLSARDGSPQMQERGTRNTLQRKASLTSDSPKSPKVTRTYSRKTRHTPSSPATPMPSLTSPSRRNMDNSGLRKRTVTTMPGLASPSKRQRVTAEDDNFNTSPSRKSSIGRKKSAGQSLSSLDRLTSLSPEFISGAKTTSHKEEQWDLSSLGPLVWVKLTEQGQIASHEFENWLTYWWPAKAISNISSTTLEIKIFKAPSSFEGDVILLQNPSKYNVLSRLDGKGQPRFNPDNFIEYSTSKTQAGSSKNNNQKIHTMESWKYAVQEMNREDLEANDGLPSTLSALLSDDVFETPVKKEAADKIPRSKSKGKNVPSPRKPLQDESWTPPLPDPLLEIPGECVLAREKKNRSEHWPARIMTYIPPSKSSEQPKYRVQFLDNFEADITRDLFYTTEQDGFATCKLGTFESVKKETEDDQENDEEVRQQSSSPEPSNPAPSSSEFAEMSLHKQFCYVKPVLRSILNDEYTPAKERHDAFIKGGQKRIAICEKAGATGDLTAKTVEELSHYLTRWVLRDEIFSHKLDSSTKSLENIASAVTTNNVIKESATDISTSEIPLEETSSDIRDCAMPPPSSLVTISSNNADQEHDFSSDVNMTDSGVSMNNHTASGSNDPELLMLDEKQVTLARQVGCSAYESLSTTEKLEYCANVLLPEALIQIMSWRSGYRQSLDILSVADEERLHALGQQKLEEIDWVNSIVQLRRYKEKEFERRLKDRPKVEGLQAGTRSRPKNTQ